MGLEFGFWSYLLGALIAQRLCIHEVDVSPREQIQILSLSELWVDCLLEHPAVSQEIKEFFNAHLTVFTVVGKYLKINIFFLFLLFFSLV